VISSPKRVLENPDDSSSNKFEERHSYESHAIFFAFGSIIFRSVFKRAACCSNFGFRHFGKGWPAARSPDWECAFACRRAD
jgi:hypothetical protein